MEINMFRLAKTDIQSTPPLEYLPTTESTEYHVGDALVITSGKAALCGATATPVYISAGKITGATGVTIPAYRIAKTMVFEAPLTAAGTSLGIGDKVTIGTDSNAVTATTTSGVAEIVGINGTSIGDTVLVRF